MYTHTLFLDIVPSRDISEHISEHVYVTVEVTATIRKWAMSALEA